jgi:hypothetical protein
MGQERVKKTFSNLDAASSAAPDIELWTVAVFALTVSTANHWRLHIIHKGSLPVIF